MPSAAILAGGRARRFDGRDKGALLVQGRTILARQLAALRPLTHDILIVGAEARPHEVPQDVRLVPDRVIDRGPLGGLDTSLAAALATPVIVVACDMPFVTTALLKYLAALAGAADAAVPRTSRGLHPLCAAYARSCGVVIEEQLATGRLAMKDLLVRLRVAEVREDDLRRFGDPDRLLANVNTPDEYASLATPRGDTTGNLS